MRNFGKCIVTNKTKYRTEKEANSVRFWIWGHDPGADLKDLHTYYCNHCNHYHIGHESYYREHLKNIGAEVNESHT